MIILNFSHPLTAAQQAQIQALAGQRLSQILEMPVQFDEQLPFALQVTALVAGIPLTALQWQSERFLVVLPSLNFIAASLLAELHGRMGYFPTVLRTRPILGLTPRQFEVAELLDLLQIRDTARKARQS
jgi:hypothetical protein